MRTPLMTAVTILFYFDAFAWSIGVVPTLYYAFTYEALPTVGGIRLMGGPFESLGLDTLIGAGIVFVFVSALKSRALQPTSSAYPVPYRSPLLPQEVRLEEDAGSVCCQAQGRDGLGGAKQRTGRGSQGDDAA
jgi:hypothetical protein